MRQYELMVIFDPETDERAVQPLLDKFLTVVTTDGGSVDKIDHWGRRRLAYEINKKAEGLYAVANLTCTPDASKELDRQMGLSEQVLRTKLMRVETPKVGSRKAKAAEAKAAKADAARAYAAKSQAPAAAAPAAATPAAATPEVEAPAAETPAAEAPAVATPEAPKTDA